MVGPRGCALLLLLTNCTSTSREPSTPPAIPARANEPLPDDATVAVATPTPDGAVPDAPAVEKRVPHPGEMVIVGSGRVDDHLTTKLEAAIDSLGGGCASGVVIDPWKLKGAPESGTRYYSVACASGDGATKSLTYAAFRDDALAEKKPRPLLVVRDRGTTLASVVLVQQPGRICMILATATGDTFAERLDCGS